MKEKSTGLFILILVLVVVATVLVINRLFFLKGAQPPIPTPAPISTPPITPFPSQVGNGKGDAPQEVIRQVEEAFPLWRDVPYQTINWKIDYLAPLSLQATLKQDTPETRQEVLDWILLKGVNPSTHQIQWKVGL